MVKHVGSSRTLSLRVMVLGITSVLGVIVLGLCAHMLWNAFQQYQTAQRIMDVVRVSAVLVKSGESRDAERLATINAYRAPAPATAAVLNEIRRHRAEADKLFAEGVALLKTTRGFADQATTLSRGEEIKVKIVEYQTKIEAALTKPVAERDQKLLGDWFTDMGSYISRSSRFAPASSR